MKIRIQVTLDIPDHGIDAWVNEYGCDRAAVRGDIREYIRTLLQESTGAQVAEWMVKD